MARALQLPLAMRLLGRLPSVSLVVAAAAVLPACASSCGLGSSGDARGCVSYASPSCTGFPATPHATTAPNAFGACSTTCNLGYYDCNGAPGDGCESTTPCSFVGDAGDGGIGGAMVTLQHAPRGLALCAGRAFFIDGTQLREMGVYGSTVATTIANAGDAAGGLACDGERLYWPVASSSDASPGADGAIASVGVDGGAPETITAGVDPGRGVAVHPWGGGVYWLARAVDGGGGLMLSPTDGGPPSWLVPAEEGDAGIARAFDLSSTRAFGVAGGRVWTSSIDGGPQAIGAPGAVAVALAFDLPYEAVRAAPGASDAGDASDAGNPSDAGDASSPVETTLQAILDDGSTLDLAVTDPPVAIIGDRDADVLYVATDTSIARVPTMGDLPTMVASGQLHVTDIALDGPYVYWTTRGDTTTSGTLRRAPR